MSGKLGWTRAKIDVHKLLGCSITTDRMVNQSGGTYRLWATKGFGTIPPNGDPLGLVAKIIDRANVDTSGVTQITVEAREVRVEFSGVIPIEEQRDLILAAVRTAGSIEIKN